jgi:hypothetical protein
VYAAAKSARLAHLPKWRASYHSQDVIARSRVTAQSRRGDGLELAGGFVLRAEASGADVDFSFPSLYHNRSSLDIRQPSSRGMLFGVAYTAPESNLFPTNLALHRDVSFYPNLRNDNTTRAPGERTG